MKITLHLNATAEFCSGNTGDCVFLDRDYTPRCKLFDEALEHSTYEETTHAHHVERCWACQCTFEEPDK